MNKPISLLLLSTINSNKIGKEISTYLHDPVFISYCKTTKIAPKNKIFVRSIILKCSFSWSIYKQAMKFYIIHILENILTLFIVDQAIGLMSRVFANGLGDRGSILGWVILKTQKMVLDAALLNTQHYKVRIKGKVEQSREVVAPSPTPWCSSYQKGSLWVTLDLGCQLYFLLIVN